MIEYSRALAIALRGAKPLPTEILQLTDCLGRVLAQEVTARHDIPNFDNSAMDGFGVIAADIMGATQAQPVTLELRGEVCAGSVLRPSVKPGTTVRLLTGGRVPPGVDGVVIQEHCTAGRKRVKVCCPVDVGENIRRQGEEYRKGDCVFKPGVAVSPPVLGMLAAFGYPKLRVFRLPQVSLVITGSELLIPGERLRPGMIYDSNSFSLSAALFAMGITDVKVLRLGDDRAVLRRKFLSALKKSDLVIAAGGVSVGQYDYVKTVFSKLGVETAYWQVAIKPGKPNYLGIPAKNTGYRCQEVFGLPGNPVAAMLSFERLVKPALLKMMGRKKSNPISLTARLTRKLKKKAGREEWVRALVSEGHGGLKVSPASGQGSHMIGGLAKANCIIVFPAGQTELPASDEVRVVLLDWNNSWQ